MFPIDTIKDIYYDMYGHFEQNGFSLYFLIKLLGILMILKILWKSFWICWNTLLVRIWTICFKRNLRKYGQWAGSTDGIGKAYAIELAKRNMDIVLISRNIQKLENCADYIRSKYEVNVKVIQADFTDGYLVYNKIESELKELDIGILVNNVGIAPPHPTFRKLENIDRTYCWNEVVVNNGAPSQITRIVLPQMMRRKRGIIVFVSSIAQVVNASWFTNYTSTKAFVSYYAKALREEIRSHNVQVQLLLPGIVDTNLSAGDHFMHKIGKSIKQYVYPDGTKYAKWASCTLGWVETTTGYWFFDLHRFFLISFRVLGMQTFLIRNVLRLVYGSKIIN